MQETPYPVRKRASAKSDLARARSNGAAQHYTIPRQPAYTEPSDDDDDHLYDYPQSRLARSAIRYDIQTDQGYTQRQLPAPKQAQARQGFHPLVYGGLILVCAVLLLIISSVVANFWQRTSDSFHYGYPRTYQVDVDVGHGDSKHPVSHFVAINDKGLIEVIELPGDLSKAKPYVYVVAEISADHADEIPVTLTFTDVDGDGKVDMQVHVNATTYTLFNTGTTFKERN